MKLTALIAAPLALLAACGQPQPDTDSLSAKIARADVVRVCSDGTLIGRDPEDDALVMARPGVFSSYRATVAPGVSVEEICK